MIMMRYFFLFSLAFGSFFLSCQTQKPQEQYVIQSSDPKVVVTELFRLAGITIGGKKPYDIVVHNEHFYDRVLSEGSLGFGESYVDGWWDCRALDQCIYKILHANIVEHISPTWKVRWAVFKAYLFNLQDKWKAKEVIDQHYQLGNDLFQKMLDPTMMYSCGYWKEVKNLDKAQEAKLDLICKKLKLKPGMTVLDIGCGWGGFEKFAAERYGVRVVGVTLSENQAARARQICEGLDVKILVTDYRDVQGKFDRIVSIGMFEHVGKKNYKDFFQVCHRSLNDDGLVLLHTIGRNTPTLITDPWIDKYIFPNGQLPSCSQIAENFEDFFIMEDWHNFGADYDKTLMAWYCRFNKNWPELEKRYSTHFYRMWKYYLQACAASFRAREIQLWQVVLSKEGVANGYESVR